jgi:hypothetical protein
MQKCSANFAQLRTMFETAPSNPSGESSDIHEETVIITHEKYQTILECLTQLKNDMDTLLQPPLRDSEEDRPDPIFLEDAVLVLQTITNSSRGRQSMNVEPLGSAVASTPTLLANPSTSRTNVPFKLAPQAPFASSEGDPLASIKTHTRCHACKRHGHWKYDPVCARKRMKVGNDSNTQAAPQQPSQNPGSGSQKEASGIFS